MRKISFNMEDEQYELMIEAMAATKNLNVSDFIRAAIDKYIDSLVDIEYV